MMERVNTTTKTLERPDLREDTSSTTDDGTPKFFHYVKKDQICLLYTSPSPRDS